MRPVIDPFYYLDNFQVMLDTLMRRDGDLLTPEERQFLADFPALPRASRALLVRLVMRKGPLFRSSRLRYAEIVPDTAGLTAVVLPLIERRWIDDDPAWTWEDVFRLYTQAEISMCLHLRQPCRSRKSALLDRLRDSTAAPPRAAGFMRAETIFRLEVGDLCDRLRRMFFGNFRQQWTEFVLADLAVFRYESPQFESTSRPFASRRHVDDFHRLHRCREWLDAGGPLNDISRAMPPVIVGCEWLEERRQKLRFQIARAWERDGNLGEAASIYSTCSYPQAAARGLRLADAARGFIRARRARATVPAFELPLDKSSVAPVEYRVLEQLQGEGGEETHVRYVENALVNSLFGLLCWPAVFAPIPGAFFHAFHRGPADLGTAGFCERRKREFDECLALLETDAYKDAMGRHFTDKNGIASPFVAWELLDEGLLRMALDCFPARHLGLWFNWMLRDLRVNRAGFPDLVQFWPRSRQYRLVEVKAPGDRLQDNQRACLEFMQSHAIPVTVCHVRWN